MLTEQRYEIILKLLEEKNSITAAFRRSMLLAALSSNPSWRFVNTSSSFILTPYLLYASNHKLLKSASAF